MRKHLRTGLAEHAVPAHIGRERRRGEQMVPVCIRFGFRVAVFAASTDGGDRPPEIVAVFRFPADDSGVRLRDAE